MPIETVPGTAIAYHLIAYDAEGRERQDDPARRRPWPPNRAPRRSS